LRIDGELLTGDRRPKTGAEVWSFADLVLK
jgi:hypothetical protein